MSPLLFSEKQRFSQWWIWLLLIAANVLFLVGVYLQVALGRPFGDKPMSNLWLLIIGGSFVVFTILFASIRLETQIREDGIYVRFFPFHLRFRYFSPDELERFYVRTYSPLTEYGGWGMRISLTGAGKAYNISGRKGLQLEFKNGKRLLIGTQKAEELSLILDQVKSPDRNA